MILILQPDTDKSGEDYRQLMDYLSNLKNIQSRLHDEKGVLQTLTEIYLVGDTATLSAEEMESFTCVERVVRISEEYRILGRHHDDNRPTYFDYNGVRFGQDNLNVFAGLCAVDTPAHVEIMMKALQELGQQCTRMGAYKPLHQPLFVSGSRQELSSLCIRAGREIRYQGRCHGSDSRYACQGNS